MFDKTQPLWLPKGSVRAIALFIVLFQQPLGLGIPTWMTGLVLTYYYGSRQAKG